MVCITSARADGRSGQHRNTAGNVFLTAVGRARWRWLAVAVAVAVPRSPPLRRRTVRPGGRACLRQRQHKTGQHDRGVDRDADGTLTPEAGSPFAAGGAGTGAGLASQGALQFSADGRFLIAVDAGSNQISVLRVHSDGALSLVPGGVVSSRGMLPTASRSTATWYTWPTPGPATATTPASGWPRRRPVAPRRLDGGTCEGRRARRRAVQRHGSKLVGTEVGTSLIDSFTVGCGGGYRRARLAVPCPGPRPVRQRVPADQPGPAVRVERTQPATAPGTVSAFAGHRNGGLSSIGLLFVDDGTASCWVEITHDGPHLFTLGTASASFAGYRSGQRRADLGRG